MNFNFRSQDFRAVVSNMWAAGKSTSEIGAVIRKSKSTVKRLVKDYNLPSRNVARGWTAHKAAKAKPKIEPAPLPIGPINDFPPTGTCQYTADHPGTGTDWRMCGHPGFPWCDHHKPICTQKVRVSP